MSDSLSEAEMIRLWELYTQLEFVTRDAVATVATITPDNYVNHVPVMTGGRGRDALQAWLRPVSSRIKPYLPTS
jgi:carboxymethylenebutenolidase